MLYFQNPVRKQYLTSVIYMNKKSLGQRLFSYLKIYGTRYRHNNVLASN
jgi:hypothetical protein